jgi:hypothetical protein
MPYKIKGYISVKETKQTIKNMKKIINKLIIFQAKVLFR